MGVTSVISFCASTALEKKPSPQPGHPEEISSRDCTALVIKPGINL